MEDVCEVRSGSNLNCYCIQVVNERSIVGPTIRLKGISDLIYNSSAQKDAYLTAFGLETNEKAWGKSKDPPRSGSWTVRAHQ